MTGQFRPSCILRSSLEIGMTLGGRTHERGKQVVNVAYPFKLKQEWPREDDT